MRQFDDIKTLAKEEWFQKIISRWKFQENLELEEEERKRLLEEYEQLEPKPLKMKHEDTISKDLSKAIKDIVQS